MLTSSSDYSHRSRYSTSTLIKDLAAALKRHGFTPGIPTGTCYRANTGQLRDFVSLLFDVRNGRTFFTCNLGIHHMVPDVSVTGRARPRRMLTRNIGYLMPNQAWHEWRLGDFPTASVDLVAECIVEYGLRWLQTFRSVDDVRHEIRRNKVEGFQIKRTAHRMPA